MPATLASIRIRNFALVEDLTWTPGAGFNAISGETGAGKSILIGALKLLLGERADRSLIRAGADTCGVEAVFDLPDPGPIAALLEEAGAEPCEDGQLLLKRNIGESANRQFVNASPCTVALLRRIGELLVDLHGPHEHQSLLSREQQTRLLDAFCGAEEAFENFSTCRRHLLDLRREREALRDDATATARELDLLNHQIAEIEEAELVDGEEEPLLARHHAASNAAKIHEIGARIAHILDAEEDSAASRLAEAGRALRELARIDERAEAFCHSHEETLAAVQHLAQSITTHIERIDANPQAVAELEQRLDLIESLKRKYGTTIADILTFAAEARARRAELETRGTRRDGLDAEITAADKKLTAAASTLAELREAGAKKLAKAIAAQLRELGFAKAGFSIHLEPKETTAPAGPTLADFIFAPNPGEPAQPLRDIASSGEISRVMLAVKSALAAQDAVPLLVFDEIDANVGGEIATCVGAKMRDLGKSHQVLCITHLPQVASTAARHFVVSKSVRGNRSVTELAEVRDADRIEEVARMLGGGGESARKHARFLLGDTK